MASAPPLAELGRSIQPAAPEPEACGAAPRPTGVFQVAEKMEKRTCALCPKGLECSILYFARSENIAAHENCLLYSSGLVECEDHDSFNNDRSFDVEAVKKEIFRGRKLKCKLCDQKGATVGCDEKSCSKNYHYFCAKDAHAFVHTRAEEGVYKVFCQQHGPSGEARHVNTSFDFHHRHYKTTPEQAYFSGMKRKRGRKKGHPANIPGQQSEPKTSNRPIKQMKEENDRCTGFYATGKVPFLKKCKDAGLLDDLFEGILDKLHLILKKLRDEMTSESEYEEIGTSLFACKLFEDTFVNFQGALQTRIHQCEDIQQQMKKEIELLQDLKQTLSSGQENRAPSPSCTSVSSRSS